MAKRLLGAFLLVLLSALLGAPAQVAPPQLGAKTVERPPARQPLPGGVTCKSSLTITMAIDLAGHTAEAPIHAVSAGGTRPMCWCSDDYVRTCQ